MEMDHVPRLPGILPHTDRLIGPGWASGLPELFINDRAGFCKYGMPIPHRGVHSEGLSSSVGNVDLKYTERKETGRWTERRQRAEALGKEISICHCQSSEES